MILFDKFIMDDSGPIYAQIIRYVKRGIVAGNIGDGDEMPSRRVLSSLLGVNPNTIQKAYRILEDEGIIQSHAGAKSYVVLDPEKVSKIRAELIAITYYIPRTIYIHITKTVSVIPFLYCIICSVKAIILQQFPYFTICKTKIFIKLYSCD